MMLVQQFFASIALLASFAAVAQVCATPNRDSATTSIAGVINSYYPARGGIVPVGSVSIPIGAVQPVGATAIAPGDSLIVMQMQGAQIDSSNSDCYGDGVGTAGCASRTTTSVTAGYTTSYTVTFTNNGVTAADGNKAKDVPIAGLACNVASCSASTTPIAGSCLAPAQWPNLLTADGVLLPGFPALGTITFVVNCNVTATGT